MIPTPTTGKKEYEKVTTDDWTTGVIEEVQRDEHRTTGFKDEKTGQLKVVDSVRFKFRLEGYKFPHYSNWMTFNYGERANLFKRYLTSLVEGAVPDMKFDILTLKGMKVKIMWKNNGEYQNVELVRPLDKKASIA